MNINSLIDYVEKNYRRLNHRTDFEILENISNSDYSELHIKKAIDYCKDHHVDSLRYLEKVLINIKKGYLSDKPEYKVLEKPSWLDLPEIKKVPLSYDERKELEELLEEFMED